MFKEIKSLQNNNIKYVLQIKEKSRTRKKDGVFFIEGKKELNLAIKNEEFDLALILFHL